MNLREEQFLRHRLFEFYLREWAFGKYKNWQDFVQKANFLLREEGITKPIAPPNSLLAENLQTILRIIKEHYHSNIPQLKNVLLYFHIGAGADHVPKMARKGFEIIDIHYLAIGIDKFIEFDLEMENESSTDKVNCYS